MRNRRYADHKAPDGGISHGWRIVRRGGRVKFGGGWYADPKLKEIEGELVSVIMGDYWETYVMVLRGALGCTGWFCNANTETSLR